MNGIETPGSAIRRGIKAVGVGKKGSKPLTPELAAEILAELKTGRVDPAVQGAFFAGLVLKGLTDEEKVLARHFPAGTIEDPRRLAQTLCGDAPEDIKDICGRLLEQKELDKETAYQLGKFLLSDLPGDGARGIAASALRVRYETADEYEGLLKSINETIMPAFREAVPAGEPVIQLSEPFDGVDHNYLLTPCLAQFLQKLNYRVVSMVGRNSGPKFCNNLYDLAKNLNLSFLKANSSLTGPKPAGGWIIDQEDLSPALDRWVDIRHQTIKRPFLATLEKFPDPCKADIIVTSAFHGVYGEKMAEVAQRAGFPGSIVVRNGIEGTIAFPLTRPAKLLCSARQKDGTYVRTEMTFDACSFFGMELPVEQKLDNPSLEVNTGLVKEFLQNGRTTNTEFDRRVAATCAGIRQAVEWIEQNCTDRQDR